MDPALRDALEQANDQLDVASALLHPLTEIGERKANEIDRALELARRHLASASAINDADRNPNAAEAFRLLLATALQFEGIALALGRRKFAEGARKIEAALKEVELNADRKQPHPMPQILHLLALIFWELRDRRSALRYIDRAVSACPDVQEYHRLRRELQGELDTGAEQTSSGRSDTRGALLAVGVVVALLVISAGSFAVWTGGQGPFWRAEQDNSDPNRFDVNPYSAHQPIVAREAELNIRALPFARADIPILRETIAGELLDVTGLVHRPEGDWYLIRLSNGEVGYIKATLTMPESEFLATSELEIQVTERDELQVAEAESEVPPGQARADHARPSKIRSMPASPVSRKKR